MISVIVSAYQAQDFLEDLIKSIDFDKAELLIVIDNCFDTFQEAKRLEKIYPQVRFFDSNVNNGPYLNFNSLVQYTKHDYLLFMGADDWFTIDAFKPLTRALYQGHEIIRFKYINYKGNKYKKFMELPADGAFIIEKKVFNKLGGFHAWRCGADTEFKLRARELGTKEHAIDSFIAMRRLHDNNLTLTSGLRSKERLNALKYIADNKGKRKAITLESIKLNRI